MITSRLVPKAENFSFPLAAPAGSVAVLVSMLVPSRALMRLKGFGNYIAVFANWGHLRWDFFKNDIPMYPMFAIRDQIGYAAGRQLIEGLEIEGGSRFEIRVTQETGIADPGVGVSLEWEMDYRNQ